MAGGAGGAVPGGLPGPPGGGRRPAGGCGGGTVLWLVGDYRAVRLRPTLLHDDTLEVRVGIRWNLHLPLNNVLAVRPAPASPLPGNTPGYLNASVVGSPNLLLEVTEPITARGPYGWRKQVTLLGLTVDDLEGFTAASSQSS